MRRRGNAWLCWGVCVSNTTVYLVPVVELRHVVQDQATQSRTRGGHQRQPSVNVAKKIHNGRMRHLK